MLIGNPISAGLRTVALVAAVAFIVAGCASANKTMSTTVVASSSTAGSSKSMPGMKMGGSSKSMSVDGIKPVPTQTLATASWQGMKIQARAMTAVPFVIFNGSKEQTVRPPKKTSFHLMIMLDDAQSGVAIPYASVWATISKAGKIVYDERQWPMLSRYMGPHYGNNVALPGAGTYQLSLLISPPVAARHVEYQNVWLKPHRVNVSFNWKPTA